MRICSENLRPNRREAIKDGGSRMTVGVFADFHHGNRGHYIIKKHRA